MGFVMLLIFLVFHIIRPQDFWPPLQGARVVFITLLLAAAIWAIQILFTKRRIFRCPQSVFIVGLWVAGVLSTYTLRWQQFTIDMVIYFAKITLLYYLISDLIDSQKKLKLFLWFFVSLCAVLATFGILQRYGIDVTNVGLRQEVKGIDGAIAGIRTFVFVYRIQGVGIFDTNQLAYAMGVALPLAFALFRTSRSIIGKILTLGAMAAFGYCVFLTESRGGMLTFMIGIILLMTVRGRLGTRFFTIMCACFVAFAIISSSERFTTAFQYKQDKSAMTRINAWYAGSQLLRAHPLIGIGVKQFGEVGYETTSHNGYVQVAAETGLIGLFFWSGLLYFSFRSLNKLSGISPRGKEAQEMLVLTRCLSLAFIQFLVESLFSNDSFEFTFYLLIGMVVAAEAIVRQKGFIEYKKPGPGTPLISKRDLVNVVAVMVLILIAWKLAMVVLV